MRCVMFLAFYNLRAPPLGNCFVVVVRRAKKGVLKIETELLLLFFIRFKPKHSLTRLIFRLTRSFSPTATIAHNIEYSGFVRFSFCLCTSFAKVFCFATLFSGHTHTHTKRIRTKSTHRIEWRKSPTERETNKNMLPESWNKEIKHFFLVIRTIFLWVVCLCVVVHLCLSLLHVYVRLFQWRSQHS